MDFLSELLEEFAGEIPERLLTGKRILRPVRTILTVLTECPHHSPELTEKRSLYEIHEHL